MIFLYSEDNKRRTKGFLAFEAKMDDSNGHFLTLIRVKWHKTISASALTRNINYKKVIFKNLKNNGTFQTLKPYSSKLWKLKQFILQT